MKIGVLKEIKAGENRVALTPPGAELMIKHDHQVLFEKDAGKASGFPDAEYEKSLVHLSCRPFLCKFIQCPACVKISVADTSSF